MPFIDLSLSALLQAMVNYGRTFAAEGTTDGVAYAAFVRGLKVALVAGEALTLDLMEVLLEALPHTRVYNLLSTTEAGDGTAFP